MKTLLVLLLLSILAQGAPTISGKWSGTFEITDANGEVKPDTAYMDLTERDGTVSGTAGPHADKQWAIRNGKLDGEKLTFEVVTEGGGVLNFELKFNGESIEGKCSGSGNGGEKMTAKVNLKRA